MRIGILSDTHDQVVRTRDAVALLIGAGAQVLIHCGDLTTAEIVYACSSVPSYFVLGNCDLDQEAVREAVRGIGGIYLDRGGLIELADRRIAVTHGHLNAELERLAELRPDYLLSGHTHRQSDEQRGATRWINPGALYRAAVCTVGVLDLASSQWSVLPIINSKMQD